MGAHALRRANTLRSAYTTRWCAAQGMDLLQDLTSIEPAIVLNAAFCERLLKTCSHSLELQQECAKVPCQSSAAPDSC